jgi:putative SOS response-associated peptidase YedK
MNIAKNIENTLNSFVTQRSQIWQKYDQAIQQEVELSNFRQFDNPSVTQTLPPITKTNSPPDEVAAAVWGMKQQIEKIKEGENLIQNLEAQIKQTKNQFQTIIAAAVAISIVLIFFLLKR